MISGNNWWHISQPNITSKIWKAECFFFCHRNSKDWLKMGWERSLPTEHEILTQFLEKSKIGWAGKAGKSFLGREDGMNICTEVENHKTYSVTHLILNTGSCRVTVRDAAGKKDLGLSHWRQILMPAKESVFFLKSQRDIKNFVYMNDMIRLAV